MDVLMARLRHDTIEFLNFLLAMPTHQMIQWIYWNTHNRINHFNEFFIHIFMFPIATNLTVIKTGISRKILIWNFYGFHSTNRIISMTVTPSNSNCSLFFFKSGFKINKNFFISILKTINSRMVSGALDICMNGYFRENIH